MTTCALESSTHRHATSSGRGNYLGRCQLCGIIGHSKRYCQYLPSSALATLPPPLPCGMHPNYVLPSAHTATYPTMQLTTCDLGLDFGASHHVTIDVANLELYSLDIASDNVIIGDGTGLTIQHTSSFTLPMVSRPLLLIDVLHVPSMSKNLISVLALCTTNPVIVSFFYSFFSGVGSSRRATFVKGLRKDGIYYWPSITHPPPSRISLSSSIELLPLSLSIWHNRLGHSSVSPIFIAFEDSCFSQIFISIFL